MAVTVFGVDTVARLCVVALLVASAGNAAVVPTVASAPAVDDADSLANPPTPPTNNSTQHRNPAEVSDSGDLQQVERWLGGRMDRLLSESALQLSQGQYEQARSLLGDDYGEHYEKYVDVAGETASDEDDDRAETYGQAQETQREFVDAVAEYRETREAYEDAKEAGNDERARELARDLYRQAERIQALGDVLTQQYAEIESFSDVDLGSATGKVSDIAGNATSETDRIVAAEFVQTRLALDDYQQSVSFAKPLRISGQVEAPNETVDAGTVVVQLGGQTTRGSVAPDGSFSLSLRPTIAPRGEQAVDVRYRPPDESIFLGATHSAPVNVTATTPTISVDAANGPVQYGDTIRVTAALTVDGTAVRNVPTAVRFGDRRVADGRTNTNGRLIRKFRVPARIPAGEQSITAVLPFENRALESVSATTAITVQPSDTSLTLDARATHVRGRLTTASGRAVAGLPVTVHIGDETRVVETNESGWYRTALPRVAEDADRSANVRVAFDGTGTNLEASSASQTVELPLRTEGDTDAADTEGQGANGLFARLSPVENIAGGIAALALIGLIGLSVWYVRRDSGLRQGTAESSTTPTPAAPQATDERGDSGERAEETGEARFARVETLIDDDQPTAAVVVLYPELRGHLETTDEDAALTHWEFYDAATARDPDVASALGKATETYERAAFAADPIQQETAQAVLALARDLTGESSDGDAQSAA